VIDWLGRPRLQRWAISLGIGLTLAVPALRAAGWLEGESAGVA
jgi:hypothetical protein